MANLDLGVWQQAQHINLLLVSLKQPTYKNSSFIRVVSVDILGQLHCFSLWVFLEYVSSAVAYPTLPPDRWRWCLPHYPSQGIADDFRSLTLSRMTSSFEFISILSHCNKARSYHCWSSGCLGMNFPFRYTSDFTVSLRVPPRDLQPVAQRAWARSWEFYCNNLFYCSLILKTEKK